VAEQIIGRMVHEIATALLPVFFALVLGYTAGKRRFIDNTCVRYRIPRRRGGSGWTWESRDEVIVADPLLGGVLGLLQHGVRDQRVIAVKVDSSAVYRAPTGS
jgi:hypothetical protein